MMASGAWLHSSLHVMCFSRNIAVHLFRLVSFQPKIVFSRSLGTLHALHLLQVPFSCASVAHPSAHAPCWLPHTLACRKRALLEHLHAARQQLLRLAQLVHWHPKSKALVECVDQGKVLDVARQHAQMLDSAAVELFEAYVRRQPESCPMLDVTTALEVLGTGVCCWCGLRCACRGLIG